MSKEIKNFIISGILMFGTIIFIVVQFIFMMKYPSLCLYALPSIFLFIISCYFSGVGMSSMGEENERPYNMQSMVFILGLLTMICQMVYIIGLGC